MSLYPSLWNMATWSFKTCVIKCVHLWMTFPTRVEIIFEIDKCTSNMYFFVFWRSRPNYSSNLQQHTKYIVMPGNGGRDDKQLYNV